MPSVIRTINGGEPEVFEVEFGFDDEEESEEYPPDCEICGGEFWDGGCSCTCENESIEEFASRHWLERIEQALWRAHKDSTERLGLDSYEEAHYYEALRFIIHHRD